MSRRLRFIGLLAGTALTSPTLAAELQPDHIVVVIEENQPYSAIVGNPDAAYINNTLIKNGTLLTDYFATNHPSQPNYFDIFSGNDQGIGSPFLPAPNDNAVPVFKNGSGQVLPSPFALPFGPSVTGTGPSTKIGTDNPPPQTGFNPAIPFSSDPTQGATTPLNTPNLGHALIAAGKTFAGYSEDLLNPSGNGHGNPLAVKNVNSTGTVDYERKHAPWVDWVSNSPTGNQLPASVNQDLTAFQAIAATGNFSALPSLSFVIPNQTDDEHGNFAGGPNIKASDDFLKNQLGSYVDWAKNNNSMLIVTWDEDSFNPKVQRDALGNVVTHMYQKLDSSGNPVFDSHGAPVMVAQPVFVDNNGNPLPVDAFGLPSEVFFDNHVPLIVDGAGVAAGKLESDPNHFSLLRTLEDLEGIPTLSNDPTVTADVGATSFADALLREPTGLSLLLGGLPMFAVMRRRSRTGA
jgi:hypothetical protein